MNKKGRHQLSNQEWEDLCDHCGKCCLVTLQDEESGEIYHTNILCRHCNAEDGCCDVYANRFEVVSECIKLTPDNIDKLPWLPKTCAYRQLFDKNYRPALLKPLQGRVISQDQIDEENLEDYIVDWNDL